MVSRQDANKARQKRHIRVRGKISGTAARPRLNVYRSLSNIYVQLIDDVAGVTLASASTTEKDFAQYGGNVEAAKAVGKTLAERATAKGITECVFDFVASIILIASIKVCLPLKNGQNKNPVSQRRFFL